MDKQHREQRLADFLAGECSPDEERELLDELQNDAAFRKESTGNVIVHRLLEQQRIPEGDFTSQVMDIVDGDPLDSSFADAAVANLQSFRRRRKHWLVASISAALTIAILVGLLVWPNTSGSGIRVAAAEGVGTIDFQRLEQGEVIDLQRGILELELNQEARVVFEAPASFRVVSSKHIQLDAGRCFAEMEEGLSGLRIETPSGDVLDLGTRFAVEVPSSTTMNVHVFDGEVEFSDTQGKVRLKEGQGLVQEQSGKRETIAAQPARFVPQVPRSVDVRGLYWSFDDASDGRVEVRGTEGMDLIGDGTLADGRSDTSGPESVAGKLGRALEFNGDGQWVSTDHPGISGSVDRTVACWVKIPADWGEGDKRGPMVSWGHKGRGVEDQAWLFGINGVLKRNPGIAGRLRLGVGKQSTSGMTDLRDGLWHHVAAVSICDSGQPTLLFYVDGQLEYVSRNEIESIHTETTDDRSQTIRFGRRVSSNILYLRGTLDEVYILEGALAGDQVRALMRNELSPMFQR